MAGRSAQARRSLFTAHLARAVVLAFAVVTALGTAYRSPLRPMTWVEGMTRDVDAAATQGRSIDLSAVD